MSIEKYKALGFNLVPIHKFNELGCSCSNPKCNLLGKHPIGSGWQHNTIEDHLLHTYKNSFGVVVDGFLIVDIDPRNGGKESYNKLCADLDIDLLSTGTFTVKTGGNGYHIYFKCDRKDLKKKHDEYKGIDFITNGMVIGCGSKHASGQYYHAYNKTSLDNILNAPERLVEALEKKKKVNVAPVRRYQEEPTTLRDVQSALNYIDPDIGHEDGWLSVGMALYNETQGSETGFFVWDNWSQGGESYDANLIKAKWRSFSVKEDGIKYGSIFRLARQAGYRS